MSIRLGTTNPSAFRLGTTAVSKLMLGVTEVWSNYDVDAQAWFDAIVAAGSSISESNKAAFNRLVVDSKADGNWSKILALAMYAGPDSYAGGIIPAKGPTPTVVGSVAAGWSRTVGITQPAAPTSNYIDSNVAGNSTLYFGGQNDFCHGCYIAAPASVAAGALYGNALTGGKVAIIFSATEIRIYHGAVLQQHTVASTTALTGFIGASRTGSTTCETRVNANAINPTAASVAPAADDVLIFRRAANAAFNGAAIGAVWFGQGLANQGLWRTRLDTYFAALT